MAQPSLIVIAPNGHRSRMELAPLPFHIGRQADNHLVIRDSRASRMHARIVQEDSHYVIEDAGSRHGLYLNGRRVQRHTLQASDVVEFGVADSYQVVFSPAGAELSRLVEAQTGDGAGSDLGRLKAVLEIARTLQSSYSLQDVLNSVLDAALAVTGAERGFLFLSDGTELAMQCARDCRSGALPEHALRVPRRVLKHALELRNELLTMSFDPQPAGSEEMENSVVDLDLRSVICVPLIRIHNAAIADAAPPGTQTAGLIYMDSRAKGKEIPAADRELLQTLAVEASVIIENARLLEEEREKRRIEQELSLARGIQQKLLPSELPQSGWFRASGSSGASLQVGGDYFDVLSLPDGSWCALVADVSGKGVSSALVASLLQGAFLTTVPGEGELARHMTRINHFLSARLEAGKYATVFFSVLSEDGRLRYVNAGHCLPLLVPTDGSKATYLDTTGMPVGMVDGADYGVEEVRLGEGEKVVIYSDGVTDAHDLSGEAYGRVRLRQVVEAHAALSSAGLHEAIQQELAAFTGGAPQADDITLLVLEYRPAS